MIAVNNIDMYGLEAAIRGMRNPKNSWYRSDSVTYEENKDGKHFDRFEVGKNDLNLMKNLTAAGPEHRKFLRMIHVSMDVVAPLYWWKEYDTYKVGTTANSCSTMHTIHAREFAAADFSCEKMHDDTLTILLMTIKVLNNLRNRYIETKDKDVWYQMIQLLPSSYNQLRTIDFSYETAITMIRQRKDHKLDEWRKFVDVLKYRLPYMTELWGITEGDIL